MSSNRKKKFFSNKDMKNIIFSLKNLKKFNVVAVKQSLEDEER